MFQQIERGFQTKKKKDMQWVQDVFPPKRRQRLLQNKTITYMVVSNDFIFTPISGETSTLTSIIFFRWVGWFKTPPTSKLFLPPKTINRSQATKALLMSRAEPHFGQAHRHLKEVRGVGWHASLSEKNEVGKFETIRLAFFKELFHVFVEISF